jgi:predicted flap endonuclease-1-like 5' DNA nuclease
MANKNQDTSKKKVKSENSKDDGILAEINAKLNLSQKDLQKQVDELTSQVKSLSKDPGKTARKLLKTIDKSYHKKLAQLQNDFDRRMESVHKIQDKVIAQLPVELAERLNLKASSPVKSAKESSKTAKITSAKVNQHKAAKPIRKPKTPSIASISGIGPVIQKKLAAAGFVSLEDLANTPKSKIEALKQFEKTRGFSTWKDDAQALIDKK